MATPHRKVLVVGVSQHTRMAGRGWVSNTGIHVRKHTRTTARQQRQSAATGQWTFGKGWR